GEIECHIHDHPNSIGRPALFERLVDEVVCCVRKICGRPTSPSSLSIVDIEDIRPSVLMSRNPQFPDVLFDIPRDVLQCLGFANPQRSFLPVTFLIPERREKKEKSG